MSKKIIYTATDNGIDGREKSNVLYAAFSEGEIKALHNKDKGKAWRTLGEEIIDEKIAIKKALSKLNGIDRAVLGLPNWLDE